MARPVTPVTSLITDVSFNPVSSSSFSNRWASWPRAMTTSVRRLVRSRSSRIFRCGTKEAMTIPEAPARARKAASLGSLFRPRIPFRCEGLTSIRFKCGCSV